MITTLDEFRGEVVTGSHLVLRVPGVAAVVRTDHPVSDAVLDLLTLIQATAAEAGPCPGRELAFSLARWVTRTPVVPELPAPVVPEFGIVAATDDGIAVFMTGEVTFEELVRDGADHRPQQSRRLSGRSALCFVDRVLPRPTGPIALRVSARTDIPAGSTIGPDDQAGWTSRVPGLVHGLVPGGGIILRPRGTHRAPADPAPPAHPAAPAPPEPPAHPAHTDPPAHPAHTDPPAHDVVTPERVTDASASAPEEVSPAPAPVPSDPRAVEGFQCSRGHLNNPRVAFCAACGIRMDELTGIKVAGIRPPLGVVVLDIGSSFVVDEDCLLGRRPELDDEVITHRLRPVRLDDSSNTLSRAHAEIRLHNWDVLIVDRGSSNGTHVKEPAAQEWRVLVPHQPFVLRSGAQVRIGTRTFTFQSAQSQLN